MVEYATAMAGRPRKSGGGRHQVPQRGREQLEAQAGRASAGTVSVVVAASIPATFTVQATGSVPSTAEVLIGAHAGISADPRDTWQVVASGAAQQPVTDGP